MCQNNCAATVAGALKEVSFYYLRIYYKLLYIYYIYALPTILFATPNQFKISENSANLISSLQFQLLNIQ